ncbi:hypothetical protein HMPREF0083_01304 [Aneurinibacillus aneurinilyticus ATCC 12856]|uniref:Uncharacterized protein n=1 Tax=Aneurinibacillus aneurinilyticus ATCC 12856 TaxID=649747 RepID=U1YII3_ANEAE|nr:hypothetical protein HMPREF0083_01304 [Aneurinibacillus aneurinilyticus ATCC 12856]
MKDRKTREHTSGGPAKHLGSPGEGGSCRFFRPPSFSSDAIGIKQIFISSP